MIALAGSFLLAASPAIGKPGRIWLLLFIGLSALLVVLAIKLAKRPKPNWSRFPLKSSCPAPQRWQEFLKGRVLKGEHYQLAVHLENCDRCQQRVEGLV